VAPEIALPALRHWYDRVSLPLATTEKLALLPAATDCDAGWVVMVGAVDVDVEVDVLSVPPPPQAANKAVATNATTQSMRVIMLKSCSSCEPKNGECDAGSITGGSVASRLAGCVSGR